MSKKKPNPQDVKIKLPRLFNRIRTKGNSMLINRNDIIKVGSRVLVKSKKLMGFYGVGFDGNNALLNQAENLIGKS